MELQFLEDLGLSRNEAKVYYALLTRGNSNSAEIARLSGVHRINVYDVLNSLAAKGLVSFILQGKQRIFKAENPGKLQSLLRNKLDRLEEKLPELEKQYHSHKENVDVRIILGAEGKKQHLEEQFKEAAGHTLYLFLSHGLATHALPPYSTHLRGYYSKLRGKQAKVKIILPEKPEVHKKAKFFSEFKDFTTMKFVKGLEPAGFSWQSTRNIVWFTILTEPMTTLRIESEQVAKIFQSQFELIWKKN